MWKDNILCLKYIDNRNTNNLIIKIILVNLFVLSYLVV